MTVRQLLAESSAVELAEWQAFDRIEPIGEMMSNLRHGILCSLVANALRGRGTDPARPADFIPSFEPPPAPKSPEQLAADLHTALGALRK